MATAIYSAITKKELIKGLAMTGEVTLRGRVLPIGGLKEKALAALRADITKVIIPEQNKKDLADIPKDIRDKMQFFPVKDMDEVVKIALGQSKKTGKEDKKQKTEGKEQEAALTSGS
jgi:ATP-dependent Lon protease